MNLLMIQSWNEAEKSYRGTFSQLFSYTSLTLSTLYSLLPEDVFDRIDVVDENSQRVDYDRVRYDLVLISFETSSALTAYKHCAVFRERGAYVVCGGYHATALPEEVGGHCDTVIAGPAEISLPQFIEDFRRGVPAKIYRNPDVPAARYTVPARDKVTMKKKLKIPGMVANRGCNNGCSYCSMGVMWKSNPRPVEDVVAEIRSLGAKIVIFYDPNFFQNRVYAIELMKAMIPLRIRWASNATADLGYDPELLALARDSGCRGLLLGLESINSSSLEDAAKRFHKAEKYKEIIANIHAYGIAVNGCFVLGFEHDTEEELLSLPQQIEYLGLDLCRFAILTPYPGTRVYDEYKASQRMTSADWSMYNQWHAVFKPRHMSPERLEEIHRRVWHDAYTWRSIFRRIRKSPWRFKPYVFILLGANIGFKFIEMDKRD